jgi:hypothetical protein
MVRACAIIRSEFLDDVLDVNVDGVLGNRQPIGYLLVLQTVANELQHVELSSGQRLLAKMLGEHRCDFRGHVAPADVHGSDAVSRSPSGMLSSTSPAAPNRSAR